MIQNSSFVNDECTFWDLIQKYKIIIPIIQRDYVQGREEDNINLIRENLLNNIRTALTENKKIDFDFIYGSTKMSGEKEVLSLLDGQQRITTLFLLHWYFAAKEKKLDENVIDVLSNFSYSNRVSSRDFCKELVKCELEIKEKPELSKQIKSKTWYFSEWDNDPTIKSMLNMLDSIHKKMYNVEGFNKLINKEHEIISFSFISLEKFNLTDELYIKMNSRGKKLTNFEIFKSKFIELVKEQNDDELLKEFIYNIESKWSDLFWEYRQEEDTVIDEIFMRYLYYITEMIHAIKIFNNENQDINKESPFVYNEKKLILDLELVKETYEDKENIKLLIDILNIWNSKEEVDKDINEIFSANYEKGKVSLNRNDYNLFENCIYGKRFNWFEKELLFAFLLIKTDESKNNEEIADFVRIVRNILQNIRWFDRSEIHYNLNLRYYEIRDRFKTFLDLKREKNIYKALLNIENTVGRLEEPLKLEKEKAKLIEKNEERCKKVIFMCEDNEVTEGNLCNILNLIEKYPENMEKFMSIFKNNEDYALIYRTMLSYEDYGIDLKVSSLGARYFYGKRDNIYDIFTFSTTQNSQQIIQNILEKIYLDMQTINYINKEEFLNNIINKNIKDLEKHSWKYNFAKYKEIWEKILSVDEDNNFIFVFRSKLDSLEKDNYNICYLTKKSASSRHINVYYKPVMLFNNLNNLRECFSTEEDYGRVILNNGIILKLDEKGFHIYPGDKKEKVQQVFNTNLINGSEAIIEFNKDLDIIEQEKEIMEKLVNV